MKIIIIALFAFLSTQALGQISGQLITAEGGPVAFANIVVYDVRDSVLVKGAVTDEAGAFVINDIPPGEYFIQCSAVGFETYSSPVFQMDAEKSIDMGTQVLKDDAQLLEEVIVQTEKPLIEQQIDRTVVNVESSIMTKGSSALQVLEQSPGVFVDMRNSTIALNGKGNVLVLLNGKAMRLPPSQVVAMLNSMSANEIEQIELMATPPANYDADGTGGVINIVMKKREEVGTSGSLSLTGGYGWGEKWTASINLSHNTGTINLYGGYTFFHDSMTDGWDATGGQNMPLFGGELTVDAGSHQQTVTNNHDGLLGADFNLGKTDIGMNIKYLSSHADRDVLNYGRYYIIESDSLLMMKGDIIGINAWNNVISNVYLERRFKDGEKLNIDLDYVGYESKSPSDGTTNFFDESGNEVYPNGSIFSERQLNTASAAIGFGVMKADYSNRLNDNITLTSGIKGTLTKSSSLSSILTLVDGEWVTSPRYMNDTKMREVIGAAYTSLFFQMNPSLSLSAGLRYEYSHTSNEADKQENEVDRKIGKFFPSVFLSKKLSEAFEIQLSYTKRINRPTFNDLTSYLMYIDPMSVGTGNPSLQPTLTSNVRAGVNYKGYTFSLLASHDKHPIVLYQLDESPAGDIMYNNPQNMTYQKSLTLQTDLPINLFPWWSMNISLIGSWRQFKLSHTEEKLMKAYTTASVNGRQNFTLPKDFLLEISGWYNAVQYDGSKKLDGFGMLNAGLKKEFGKQGSLQLTVTDLLKSMRVSGHFGTLTDEAFSLYAHFIYKAESANNRIVKLTYTRSFGNTRTKTRERNAGSEDERGRIKK